jgi:hypothetical protein
MSKVNEMELSGRKIMIAVLACVAPGLLMALNLSFIAGAMLKNESKMLAIAGAVFGFNHALALIETGICSRLASALLCALAWGAFVDLTVLSGLVREVTPMSLGLYGLCSGFLGAICGELIRRNSPRFAVRAILACGCSMALLIFAL